MKFCLVRQSVSLATQYLTFDFHMKPSMHPKFSADKTKSVLKVLFVQQ